MLRVLISTTDAGNAVFVPSEGVSLRALERLLTRNNVPYETMREGKRIFVPLSEWWRAREALAGYDLHIESGAERAIADSEDNRLALLRAHKLVRSIDQPGVADAILGDYPQRHRLDHHQFEAVAAITHPDVKGICIFDEQGLGKTVTTLFAYDRLRDLGQVSTMFVIAPKNMVLEWSRDAERFFGSKYKVEVAIGDVKEKRVILNRPADIYVTNFETTVSLEVKVREVLRSQAGFAMLVVDESFFVKNAQATRTQAVRQLRREVGRCIVLCGTPAPNSPHDIIEQFNIADGGIAFGGVRIPQDREEARPVVQRCIESRGIYVRRLKQAVMPMLPPKTFNRVLVPMEPVQERAYAAALQNLVHDLRTTSDIAFKKDIASFLARRAALLQICSNPASVVEAYGEVPAKIVALDAILEELVARRSEKVVVWSFFTKSLDLIMSRYERFQPVRCDGTVARSEDRREAVRRFQEDDSTMLFVANPAAAGAGITLHRARYAVYESMSNQAAHYLQSLDRIHRRGQDRAVEYLVLLCDRTIELPEYDRLIAKEAAAQELLGDDVMAPSTRIAMLAEAEAAAQLLEPLRTDDTCAE